MISYMYMMMMIIMMITVMPIYYTGYIICSSEVA